jgi:uncharacterized membrane protein YdjX (TVP38/TMEM64 family)
VKKNLIFMSILLASFALSKLLTLYQPQDNTMDTMFINTIQQSINMFKSTYIEHPLIVTVLFSVSFLILTVAYIPFTGPFYVLFAGALYGFSTGAILFSFLVSISYTASFLVSKYIFIKYIKRKKFNRKIQSIVDGFEKDRWVYLLSIRFSGIIPATLVNTGMGVTNIPIWQFYVCTQIGTLPLVIVYAFAGSKIENLKSMNDFVSPYFFLLLMFLSITPIILKIFFEFIIVKMKKYNENT